MVETDIEDLNVELIEKEGGRLFTTEPHPDPSTGEHIIRGVPDETVPLIEYMELSARVEDLTRKVHRMVSWLDCVGVSFSTAGRILRSDTLPFDAVEYGLHEENNRKYPPAD